MAQFRQFVWDPWLLTAQMVCLQALFYLALGVWYFFTAFFITGYPVDLDHLLSSRGLNDANLGWFSIVATLLNSLSSGAWLALVVGRARLVLDFTVSMYSFHLVYCIVYDGWPSLLWWGVTVACCISTTVFGEYLCMRRELREIPILGGRAALRGKETAEQFQMQEI